MILVDADVWIDFFTGSEPGSSALERLLGERRAALSTVTAFELEAGIVGEKRKRQVEVVLAVVPSHPLTQEGARRAAAEFTRLKRAGQLIGTADLLLAGTALDLSVPVLTRNVRHFRRIEDLVVHTPASIFG